MAIKIQINKPKVDTLVIFPPSVNDPVDAQGKDGDIYIKYKLV